VKQRKFANWTEVVNYCAEYGQPIEGETGEELANQAVACGEIVDDPNGGWITDAKE